VAGGAHDAGCTRWDRNQSVQTRFSSQAGWFAQPWLRLGNIPEVSMDDWSSVRLCDVVNLILSVVLFFSPWLFDLSAGAQWQTASTVGIIIAVLSIAALAAFAVWEEWFMVIAGLALIVSPWLLGFQNTDAMSIDVIIGLSVAVLAAFEVYLTRERELEMTASQ
jgi:hypothetical protein